MVLALFTCKEGQQWQFWYFGTLRKKQSTKTSTKKKPDLSRFLSLFLYFGTLVLCLEYQNDFCYSVTLRKSKVTSKVTS